MTVSRDIRLSVIGETRKYQAAMAQIPGITQREAARAAVRFERELSRAQAAAAKEAEKAARNAIKAWDLVGPAVAASLSVDAIKAAGGFVLDFASNTFEARTEILNLAEATSISTETLAGLEVGVGRVGGNFEEVLGSVEDFGERLFDFSIGAGEAKEAFELLGFTAEEAKARYTDVDGVFRDVLERMGQMEDGALKNAVAQQLFSDAGNRLNAVFANTTLDEQIALAREYGLVVDDEAAASTREWNAAMSELKGVLGGTATELLDFLNLGQHIRNFALGFVFLREAGVAAFDVLIRRAGEFTEIFRLLSEGELVKANEAWLEFGGTADDALREVNKRATDAAREYFKLTQAVDLTTGATGRQTRAVGQLSDQLKKQQQAAAKAAAARAKQLAEEERQMAAILSANDAIGRTHADATADILSGEEKIQAAFDARIDSLLDAVEAGGSQDAANAAFAEAEARRIRDLANLEKDRIKKQRDLEWELDQFLMESIAERHRESTRLREEEMQQLLETTTMVQEFAALQIAAFQGVADFFAASSAREVETHKSKLDRLQGQRRDYINEIKRTDDEAARNAARQAKVEVEAKIEAERTKLAEARKSARNAALAQRAGAIFAVGVDSAAAAIKSFAMFGAPPSPVGIAAAAASGLAGAAAIASIISEPLPSFFGGGGRTSARSSRLSGDGSYLATLHPEERVLNARATRALGDEVVSALNEGLAPLQGLQGGGGGDVYLGAHRVGSVMAHQMRRASSLSRAAADAGRDGRRFIYGGG